MFDFETDCFSPLKIFPSSLEIFLVKCSRATESFLPQRQKIVPSLFRKQKYIFVMFSSTTCRRTFHSVKKSKFDFLVINFSSGVCSSYRNSIVSSPVFTNSTRSGIFLFRSKEQPESWVEFDSSTLHFQINGRGHSFLEAFWAYLISCLSEIWKLSICQNKAILELTPEKYLNPLLPIFEENLTPPPPFIWKPRALQYTHPHTYRHIIIPPTITPPQKQQQETYHQLLVCMCIKNNL